MNEVVLTRTLDAPRELVFAMWIDPDHLAAWWGPAAMRSRCELDARVGGSYRITMTAPDGTEFPMKGVYREIVPPERLVYTHDLSEHPDAWHDALDPGRDRCEPRPALEGLVIVTFDTLEGRTLFKLARRLADHERNVPMSRPRIKGVVPHLVVAGAAKALEFYQKAFGALVVSTMPTPDGQKLMHAVMTLDGHEVYLVDEFPDREEDSVMRSPAEARATTVSIALKVDDADAVYDRAIQAGARDHMPVADTFWGARYGQVLDPYGHLWEISQEVQARTEDEMKQALAAETGRDHG